MLPTSKATGFTSTLHRDTGTPIRKERKDRAIIDLKTWGQLFALNCIPKEIWLCFLDEKRDPLTQGRHVISQSICSPKRGKNEQVAVIRE